MIRARNCFSNASSAFDALFASGFPVKLEVPSALTALELSGRGEVAEAETEEEEEGASGGAGGAVEAASCSFVVCIFRRRSSND